MDYNYKFNHKFCVPDDNQVAAALQYFGSCNDQIANFAEMFVLLPATMKKNNPIAYNIIS